MKKFIIPFAVALTLPVLFSCNKDNGTASNGSRPVTLTMGQHFNTFAGTYSSEAKEDVITDNQGNAHHVMSVHRHSNNADGSWVSWDEVVAVKSSIFVGYKYNFQTGTYSVTVKDGDTVIDLQFNDGSNAGEIRVEKNGEGQTSVVFTPINKEGEPDTAHQQVVTVTSKPDPGNPEEIYTNGTWVVNETIATARGLNFSQRNLDVHAIASWAQDNIGVEIKKDDLDALEGYKVKNIVITDSALSLNFENGKSFASSIDIKQYNGFKIENFVEGTNSNISEYINGTGSFSFSGDLCILSIAGSFKENKDSQSTPVTIMLTLKRQK